MTPPGYKQTEVGVIPEEWEEVRLTELVSYGPKNGYSGQSGKKSRGTPTLSLSATSSGCLVLNEETIKRLDETIDPRSDLYLKPGDVLVQRSNTPDLVGTTAVFNGPPETYVYPDLMMRMRFREDATAHWFWRYANSNSGRRFFVSVAAGSSGSMPKISGEKLRAMQLPHPPLPEQRAIAKALSDMDALLAALDRLIAKKRDLKQAAMQQLLTGQSRLPGFHEEWVVKRLNELADIRSGGTPSTSVAHFWDGNIPWCTPTDITALNGHKYLGETNRLITPLGLKASSSEMIPAHSIVMTSRATIGECAINTVPVSTNQGFKNFVPFDSTDVDFLYYLLTTQKQGFISLCGGSTFLEIGKTQLIAYQVNLPNAKAEQTAIASVLSEMDAELATLEQRRDKTRALKQGMMQELLTGRTRLVASPQQGGRA